MHAQSSVLVLLSNEAERPFANQLAQSLGFDAAHVVIGQVADAIAYIERTGLHATYVVLDIGPARSEILPSIDLLAQHCVPGTQVVVIGNVNDIQLYRALTERGVKDYFTHPVTVDDVRKVFLRATVTTAATNRSRVITCMSAAAGDGSSTVALNVAYALASEHRAPTILVDMDYQFGMVAKNLDVSTPYGIRELFDFPGRGIDVTLVERMAARYADTLHVIAAPNELAFMPSVLPDAVRDLIAALREKYTYVVLDPPHVWAPWVSAACSHSDILTLTAQLWLKSATHATRLLNSWREIGVSTQQFRVVVNRSGAKFKEAVSSKDFERVTGMPIHFYLPNDIKTVVQAENTGKTVLEIGRTPLADEFRKPSDTLAFHGGAAAATPATTSGSSPLDLSLSLLKRLKT